MARYDISVFMICCNLILHILCIRKFFTLFLKKYLTKYVSYEIMFSDKQTSYLFYLGYSLYKLPLIYAGNSSSLTSERRFPQNLRSFFWKDRGRFSVLFFRIFWQWKYNTSSACFAGTFSSRRRLILRIVPASRRRLILRIVPASRRRLLYWKHIAYISWSSLSFIFCPHTLLHETQNRPPVLQDTEPSPCLNCLF